MCKQLYRHIHYNLLILLYILKLFQLTCQNFQHQIIFCHRPHSWFDATLHATSQYNSHNRNVVLLHTTSSLLLNQLSSGVSPSGYFIAVCLSFRQETSINQYLFLVFQKLIVVYPVHCNTTSQRYWFSVVRGSPRYRCCYLRTCLVSESGS